MSRPSRLLIIDDSPAEIDLWHSALLALQWNAVITEALSGRHGLDLLQQQIHREDAPDIVLLDYSIRGESCLATLRRIRLIAFYAQLPVIILADTAIPEPMRREFHAFGVLTMLVKPTTFAGFSRQIDILRTSLEGIGCITGSGSWVASRPWE
jgi:CheY-like chemotaxis protein